MCATERPVQEQETINHFARLFYWASLCLLLVGAWGLIDPDNRQPGQTAQIYITVGIFEGYIWLLLALGRWQLSKNLTGDAVRGAVFAAVLSGLQFISVNELHTAAPTSGLMVMSALIVLTVIRLMVAKSWLGLRLPWPLFGACCAWVAALAAPPAVIHLAWGNEQAQNALGLAAFWMVAILVAGHIALVAWQKREGWREGGSPLDDWRAPWVLLAILGGVGVLQLLATTRALSVDWAQWYFSPVALAVGVVAVAITHARGAGMREAWILLGLAAVYAASTAGLPLPDQFPSAARAGLWAYVIHPVYPPAVLASAMMVGAAFVTRRWWMLGVAAACPVAAGVVKAVAAIWSWRYAKQFLLVFGAFVLLAGGGLLQWLGVRQSEARGQAGTGAQGPVEVEADVAPTDKQQDITGPA